MMNTHTAPIEDIKAALALRCEYVVLGRWLDIYGKGAPYSRVQQRSKRWREINKQLQSLFRSEESQ